MAEVAEEEEVTLYWFRLAHTPLRKPLLTMSLCVLPKFDKIAERSLFVYLKSRK